jgi:hypothetical protein
MRFDEKLRRDPINYDPGQVVEFHRLAKGGFKSGQHTLLPAGNDRGHRRPEGSGVLRGLRKQRATLLKADGKDILSVKMHLNSERQAE